MQAPHQILLAALLAAAILGSGCARLAPAIAVRSPAPVASAISNDSLSPSLRTNLLWHAWPLPARHDALEARFREAREAFRSYDTKRATNLFLDTGYSDSIGKFTLYDTTESLAHLIDTSAICRRWKPSFTFSLNSFRVRFPRQIRPVRFWFSGRSFVRPAADIRRLYGNDSLEPRRFDGLLGDAPFTSGTLRLAGTRRFAAYRASE